MRSRLICMVVSMIAMVALAGCGAPTPTASVPTLGLHSPGDSAAIGDTTYTVTADFSSMPDRPDVELMTVRVEWVSTIPHKTGGLSIQAFASDGAPRVETADAESLGGASDEMRGSESGSSGEAKALFSVHKGETGLVVTVDDGKTQDLRWQVR